MADGRNGAGETGRAAPGRARARRILGLLAASSVLTGCTGVLAPRGPVGAANRLILLDSLGIMLAIVIPTLFALIGFAWWYRESNDKATYDPEFVYSGQIEVIVWGIPTLVILFLGGLIWIGSHKVDPATPLPSKLPPLEVQVVSLDWKWLFVYPQLGMATVNRLVIPAGRPVHFALTSSSVMNSFFVPELGSQIYTMNGMATQLNLQADAPGTFAGQSSHFSGDGFAGMRFEVQALPPAGFAKWVGATRAAGPALDARGYAALARQYGDVNPYSYRSVIPGLFDAVVRQTLPAAAGPAPLPGGHQISNGAPS